MGGYAVITGFWLLIGVAAAIMAVILFGLFPLLMFAADKIRRANRVRLIVFALFALAAIIYGGSKGPTGKVTVDDDYIADAGSYLTNDIAHVAISRKSLLLPDSTEILVYARELSSTNAADWFRLTPSLTFVDHPYDYSLPNATNYNVIVAASYTPAPTVHTNGVWIIRGFEIPDNPGKFAFPNSKVKTIEVEVQ